MFYGLTGLGMLHLARDPASPLLEDILAYLTRLTRPLTGEHGQVPGWWTPRDPAGQASAAFPGGHLNLGMAHGIAGPLALMSAAARHGITVTGQHEAIATICAVLDTWRQDSPAGPWWPQWITWPEYATGHTAQPRPGRPSWCYGTLGLARAQQLAGTALADPARQRLAEHALLACLNDPASLARITDATLCHGTAGLLLTTHHAARDAPPGTFTTALRHVRVRHRQLARQPGAGLLEGSTGTALADYCDTTAGQTASGWDACILPT